jgi:hypothetical protein
MLPSLLNLQPTKKSTAASNSFTILSKEILGEIWMVTENTWK